MVYHLDGQLVELCTCGTHCPCRAQGTPDNGECTAANVWHIENGSIDATDVSGLTLVALSHLHGHVIAGRPVVFYVDERATDEQQMALLAVWTGKQGGPVADVAHLFGTVVGVERAPIAFTINGGRGSVHIGQVVSAQLAPTKGSHGDGGMHEAAAPHTAEGPDAGRNSGLCTTIPGSRAAMGEAASYRIAAPNYGFAIDLRNHSITQGRFEFNG